MVVASRQKATFTSRTRTASYQDSKLIFITKPGRYKFASLIIKDYARVHFQATGQTLSLGQLELHYKAILFGEQLLLEGNDVVVHPGAKIDLSKGGYGPGKGPGKGITLVSIFAIVFNFFFLHGREKNIFQ